jgi:hypothetical protein
MITELSVLCIGVITRIQRFRVQETSRNSDDVRDTLANGLHLLG